MPKGIYDRATAKPRRPYRRHLKPAATPLAAPLAPHAQTAHYRVEQLITLCQLLDALTQLQQEARAGGRVHVAQTVLDVYLPQLLTVGRALTQDLAAAASTAVQSDAE